MPGPEGGLDFYNLLMYVEFLFFSVDISAIKPLRKSSSYKLKPFSKICYHM